MLVQTRMLQKMGGCAGGGCCSSLSWCPGAFTCQAFTLPLSLRCP